MKKYFIVIILLFVFILIFNLIFKVNKKSIIVDKGGRQQQWEDGRLKLNGNQNPRSIYVP